MKNRIKIASLFSGIGGFEKGFEKSKIKFDIVFASEIDKQAIQTYGYNFSIDNMHGNIKEVSEKDVPKHDLLCAGFPCQTFSIAGTQKGFEDIRGTLFFDIMRIIKEKQPKYILLENVKNLINHDKGQTIRTILKNISDCGYTFDITVINSKEAGVPQGRERTYIVGKLNHEIEKFEKDIRNQKINVIKEWANENNLKTMNFFNKIKMNIKQKYLKDILDDNIDEKYYFSKNKVDKILKTIEFKDLKDNNELKIVKEFDIPKEIHNDMERQRRTYSIFGISPTLLARSDSPKIIVNESGEYRIRKLTPYETLKVQGFDEQFAFNVLKNGMSDTQLYKQSGNAVSPPVITEIANAIEEFLYE